MLSKKSNGRSNAQISSGELLVAYFIFFMALVLAIILWSNIPEKIKDSERLYDLEETTVDIAEKLVRTEGVPSTWSKENVTVIGLVSEPRILSQDKILEFLDMMNDSAFDNPCTGVSNYECYKHILGVGKYEFSFNLTDTNGTTIEIENRSCYAGIKPSDELETLPVTRTAILNDEIVRMKLIFWYNESAL